MIPYQTRSQSLDLKKLDPAQIKITDIAWQLSRMCRFNGATAYHYSVAQHSLLCAQLAPAPAKLYALLHDAHEYILGDIPAPVTKILSYYAGENFIDRFRDGLDAVIFETLGVRVSPQIREVVGVIDAEICKQEMDVLLYGKNPENSQIFYADPLAIERRFLHEFYFLKNEL